MDWIGHIFWKLRYLLTARQSRRKFDDEVDDHILLPAERFQAQE